ncbi:MAG: SipW-dependent-type signal peptide-containing protein [Candidatus Pacebacteria bacterium]|nr:SipW-dependent-type signal peptide-containing protein [Candidatus Paceibacterota bacterium]
MKKILLSLAIIVAGATMVTGATMSYFSDTETSTGNTFTAGTIDISIDGENPWTGSFALEDMKPCYTDYINFRIDNDGSDPNPVNIYKLLTVTDEGTGAITEPECNDQRGVWTPDSNLPYNGSCDFSGVIDDNNLSAWIIYDLSVEVYDASGNRLWWQTIYVDADGQSIDDIYGVNYDQEVYLGMIPVGGYMLVEQSYHLNPLVSNWAQGDTMTFDIVVKGEQLYGTAWLEDKDYADDTWKVDTASDEKGTLTYKVKNPTFDFTFTGKAPLTGTKYFLVAGPDVADPTIELGYGTTDASGDVTITGDKELGVSLVDAKVWLVPEGNWDGTEVTWSGWPNMDFLWETGLFWYVDTDL